MKYMARLVILICTLLPFKLFCQNDFADDTFISKATENTTAAYQHSLGINAGVYNGVFYLGYDFKFTEGSPYFYSDSLNVGWAVYDSLRYDSILLQYDEVIDELIAANATGKMRLWTPKVSSFSIFKQVFIALKKDDQLNNNTGAQFYRLLYKGNMMVVDKERKEIKENISGVELQRFIVSKTSFYIIQNGAWHSISSKKDFYKLIGDHKDEVKSFVKANNLSFKNDKGNMLAKAVAYYETLR